MTIPQAFASLVPEYRSRVWKNLILELTWDRKYAEAIERISAKRANNRRLGYLTNEEIERASIKLATKGEASIRFGNLKRGYGYSGERGDFCLVGGVIRGRNLTLLYRSLELIGGLAYDLTLIASLETLLGIRFKTVTIFAVKAFTFALKGNSNQKLFPKLQEIFSE